MKPPNKLSDSSSSGCECYYFSNGDKTGWKVYRNLDSAKLAWASQIWAMRKDIAPFILSGIKETNIDPPLYDSYRCPVSNRYIDLLDNEYVLDKFNGRLQINCSQHLVEQQEKNMCYAFLTEEVDIIADHLEIRSSDRDYFLDKAYIGDIHGGNWGISGNRILFIDFGSHFSYRFSDKQKTEIEKIMTQA